MTTNSSTLTSLAKSSDFFANFTHERLDSINRLFSRKHTRRELVEMGAQYNVSDFARGAQYTLPVFITNEVYTICNSGKKSVAGDDRASRLWSILWTLRGEMTRNGFTGRIRFSVYFQMDEESICKIPFVAFCTVFDFDDERPAMTILLPTEE